MSNEEKYIKTFVDMFNITDEKLNELAYQSIPEWDSVGHMSLIAALEEAFDILMDTDDIIDFSSFAKGKELLQKYDVEIG